MGGGAERVAEPEKARRKSPSAKSKVAPRATATPGTRKSSGNRSSRRTGAAPSPLSAPLSAPLPPLSSLSPPGLDAMDITRIVPPPGAPSAHDITLASVNGPTTNAPRLAIKGRTVFSPVAGTRFGDDDRFEIVKELGAGGMGKVFRAIDWKLDRPVAIKFILQAAHLPWDQLVDLLSQEAKATAKLNHENIVAIFDLGTWDGVPYLVMELMEGETLDAILERDRVPPQRAVDLMSDVARGLDHAHQQGIIHRDLKPANIFVLKDGRAKILDFGLARFDRARGTQLPLPSSTGRKSTQSGATAMKSGARAGSNVPLASAFPSQAGPARTAPSMSVAGSPAYMAPEQWQGTQQDGRTDVWAVGVILFELFTGHMPFEGRELVDLRSAVLSRQPAPSVRVHLPDSPEEAERLIARALMKDPAQRFQSSVELGEALATLKRTLTRTAPLPTSKRGPERRQLTVLSCSLGQAALSDEDPEEMTELLSTFHRVSADTIRQFDGTIVTSVSGKLLACFGYPAAHDNDAQQAVRAGLRITEVVKGIGQSGAVRFDVKVAVHTGLVVVEDMGGGESAAPVIQGNAPAVAGSLAQLAEPNTVVISQPTLTLVRGLVTADAMGARTVEGSLQPIQVFRVLRESGAESRFDQFTSDLTPLVGRQGKVKQLLDLWDAARDWKGQFVMISGEAGIGKSRLVQVLKDRALAETNLRLLAQCWPHFRNSAFYPIAELLSRIAGITREDSPSDKLEKLEALLARVPLDTPPAQNLTLIASLLSIPLPAERFPPLALSPAQQRRKTLETLAMLFVGLSTERPVLLMVEDLHWVDHSTLELLSLLLDLVPSSRLLVAVTFRPEFQHPWPERPHLSTIELTKLQPRQIAAMVQKVAGDRELPAELVDQLVAKTDGIPLFVEEMTRMVLETLGDRNAMMAGGTIAAQIPSTLHDLLLARLDRLGSAGKEAASVGAVIGRQFHYGLIQKTWPHDEPMLQKGLAHLTEAGIVQAHGRPPESRYQFKHALIQEAAYQSLVKKKRQQLHNKVAQILVADFADLAETQPELLGHHFSEAGVADQAIPYWEKAAQRAVQRSANVEAAAQYKRALSLLKTLPEKPERNQRELGLLLSFGSPMMASKGYANPEVREVYARARELCKMAGSDDGALYKALLGLWQVAMVGGDVKLARDLTDQLLPLSIKIGNSGFRVLAERAHGTTVMLQGDVAACREHCEIGLSLYDVKVHGSLAFTTGHDPGVALGNYGAWSTWLTGNPDLALARVKAALALAESLNHPMSMAFAHCFSSLVHLLRGEREEARRHGQTAVEISEAYKLPVWSAWSHIQLGGALAELGDAEVGIAMVQKNITAWTTTGARAGMTHFMEVLAGACLATGRLDDGLAAVDESYKIIGNDGELYCLPELHRLRGELLLAKDPSNQSEAESLFVRSLDLARSQREKSYELRSALSLARIWQKRGKSIEAEGLVKPILDWFGEGSSTADHKAARTFLEAG